MECEICGGEIFGKGLDIIVDGVKLKVCTECAHHGIPAPRIQARKQIQEIGRTQKTTLIRQQPSVIKEKTAIQEDLELVENYSSVVRKGREQMHLTHEELSRKIGEKVSVLQKLETSKIVPEQVLARKLEYALKIKLLQVPSKISTDDEFSKKPSELTLGDVVFMRKKENKITENGDEEQ